LSCYSGCTGWLHYWSNDMIFRELLRELLRGYYTESGRRSAGRFA
jgi:hypothetical protein